jgi:hypothetical protein
LAGGIVQKFREPQSLPDIVHIIQDAEAAGTHVRVVGSGWAFEDIAYSPDVMVSLVRLNAVLDYVTDPTSGALLSTSVSGGRRLIHVEGGIKVAALNRQLAIRGLAMPTLGGANGQSFVGALSTSTHGADFDEPPFCDVIHALHLVGVGGQEYWIERATTPITSNARLGRVLPCSDTLVIRNDELFDAVAVGLGRFGIIYSVIVEVVAAYSLARERVMLALPVVIGRLRDGINQGLFLDPLLGNLPLPSANLNAVGSRPRAMELILDSRNPSLVHVVRRWQATGPDFEMAVGSNPLCDMGAPAILTAGAGGLPLLGMNPISVDNPVLLADPSRPARLSAKQAELQALAAVPMRPGDALAIVTNAYWEFGISKLPDLLALVSFSQQFKTQRGPSYTVMTGAPAFDTDGLPLAHEIHWCYQANSCEIMFDAADRQYVDFVARLAAAAPTFQQAGYISLRYSHRSRCLLSMHNVASDHAVSIEVSTLKGLRGSAAWIEFVLIAANAAGGRPHWGQQNHPTPVQMQQLYGARFDRWRAVLGGFSGRSALFSSAFTTARGLEPQGAREIPIEGRASELASSLFIPSAMLLLSTETERSL